MKSANPILNHRWPALLLLVWLTGCMAPAPPPLTVPENGYLRWPAAPEIPRVIYLQSVRSSADLGIRASLMQRLRRGFTGEREAPLQRPHGVAGDGNGRLYIVNKATGGLHLFDAAGNRFELLRSTDSGLTTPIDIAIDERRQRFFVSDSAGGDIRIFALDSGRPADLLVAVDVSRPTGLAINPLTDELLVVDTGRATLVRVDLESLKKTAEIGGAGEAPGQFNGPVAVAVGPDGRIHVVDSLNHRIQVFAGNGEFLHTFGSAGMGPGYFSRPKAIGVDSEGNIHVLDTLFDNIQVFDPDGRLLMAYGGPGQAPGKFWLPADLFIDGKDRIYVADTYNDRVQIFQFLAGGELP